MEILSTKNNNALAVVFPSVVKHQTNLLNLNRWWDKVALVGKINSLNVPQSLLANMLDTKGEFADLQELLIENLLAEQLQQVGRKHRSMARTLIDIPNRNLFERTADVGFLATDARFVNFLKAQHNTADTQRIVQHMQEYAAKYSVYDDVILLDPQGSVRARMNNAVAEQLGTDPVVQQLISSGKDYVEVCRYSALCPHKTIASLFLAPVRDPHSNELLGVLCLSFKLEDEMTSLFADLDDGSGLVMALLDARGKVLVASDQSLLARGELVATNGQDSLITLNNHQYFCTVAPTRGYQGYVGLSWQGCVLMPLSKPLEHQADDIVAQQDVTLWQGFSATLSNIQRRSRVVTDDLDLVVLNGRIAAARTDADEFIPILEEIRQIGRQMQGIFSRSVRQLMTTALTTHYNSLSAQAALAIDIMDRNLYERANDCRWWALTETFTRKLAAADIPPQAAQSMSDILAYINNLYTVYQGIYVYDKNGRIIAVSNPGLKEWQGTQATEQSFWQSVMSLTDTQQYAVSAFHPCDYYQQRPTYIYNAAIRSENRVVGGIGLVFDSEPEFRQMLDEVLHNADAKRMGVFVERSGKVISASSNAPWQAGEHITLPADIVSHRSGEQGAGIYTLEGQQYVVGFAVSKGYREYKTTDGYSNDILALMVEQNSTDA
ncbi:MAG: cache domain-containing protein [Alteromonas oceani]